MTAATRAARVYLLPTRHGLYFALVLTAMLLTAVNYANGLAYLFTFTLASVAVVSMLYTHRNIARLELRAGASSPVFAGQDAVFPIHLHNRSTHSSHGVWLQAGGSSARTEVPAGAIAQIDLHVPTRVRGVFTLPPVALTTRFPLGLLFAWRRGQELGAHCVVFPRPADHASTPRARGGKSARARSEGEPEGDDFAGLREYRDGDPPRHVDWKAMARGRGMHTKLFDSAAGTTTWLEWEHFAPLDAESRLSALCRAVLDADRDELRYGLRLPGAELTPSSGPRHLRECLTALALWQS
jgi:uncharacterized protein (DUF58 family)